MSISLQFSIRSPDFEEGVAEMNRAGMTVGTQIIFDRSKGSGIVEMEGETYYRIEGSDGMDPFLVNLVSANNHWMFIASNGALTAGRQDADNALFPYCTQDKLFELAHAVGSVNLIWVERPESEGAVLWEPFGEKGAGHASQTNLYKNAGGNKLIFEEVNSALGLRFRYSWTFSDRFGFVRQASIEYLGKGPVALRVLDGIQNLVPYGLDQAFVSQFSNLADAYKKSELLVSERIGIFYLSSIPTDRAEPSEGLRATVAWIEGVEPRALLLSNRQLKAFRDGKPLESERDQRGGRGAYLAELVLEMEAGQRQDWSIVADINQDAVQIESLRSLVRLPEIRTLLQKNIIKNAADLRMKVASADGLSLTSDRLRDSRHYSNALFNIMRGGVFNDGYRIDVSDFLSYLESRNRSVYSGLDSAARGRLKEKEGLEYGDLIGWASESDDPDLIRLSVEYLPLTFSRRHGDPSRPWNRFSIATQDREGNPILGYEGNWRDIFQNWEALAHSYPGYLPGMVMRFLNATTADGYNPYRVTRNGMDWETLDPDEPWSNIGYWGDHQIIYLLKLLEASSRFEPSGLNRMMDSEMFVYADVPYRIRSFSEIWKNPRETVDFCDEAAEAIDRRCDLVGTDGKLAVKTDGNLVKGNLLEKLLIPLLSKLSNFVPDGGIWMNTQRPEWNDANNALVGYGVSVVTLCYTNRYIEFLQKLLQSGDAKGSSRMDSDVALYLRNQSSIFGRFEDLLESGFEKDGRKDIVVALGQEGEAYRTRVYEKGLSGDREPVSIGYISGYLERVRRFVAASIDANRRPDGMYQSYNLLNQQESNGLELDPLPVMLEGQVAALSSGRLSVAQAVSLLDSLRASDLYREDARSYLLYPDRALPTFLEKNVVEKDRVDSIPWLGEMIAKGDTRIIKQDNLAQYRFSGDFRNSGDLLAELSKVRTDYSGRATDEAFQQIGSLFDDTFDHRRFTGRSSTFFAYEGLGSVYWHMISKLLLAIQENWVQAVESGWDEEGVAALKARYYETLEGLGIDKPPQEYGAFPVDAYSHTPKHAGAQQPGMTGQVKEDLLTRFGELGIQVKEGRIFFNPGMLRRGDFLREPEAFHYIDCAGNGQTRMLQADELAFTFCQTLFVLRVSDAWKVGTVATDGKESHWNEASLSFEESQRLFSRDDWIAEVYVEVPESELSQ